MNNSTIEINSAAFIARVDGLMSRLCRGMVRHEQNYLTRGALTMPQFWALELLHGRGGCRMADLVTALHVKSSTGTMLVNRLARLRLVRRAHSVQDRRAVDLTLTPHGRRVVDEIHRQRRRGLGRMFKPLSARERGAYVALLEKLARELLKE
ncbi:MAG: MarR family transcriptional regulator [Lentisphaerae bacterium]|nr:MarR family transcriptional regulator [Lentisphaerota bacterium]